MKRILVFFSVILFAGGIIWWYLFAAHTRLISPLGKKTPKPQPLLVYSFPNLKKTRFAKSVISLGRVLQDDQDSVSQIFYFTTRNLVSGKILHISGLANIPKTPGKYPVIVMFRGFVPTESYQPGIGTQPAANVFVRNGFITLSPDFLGFGESDKGPKDPFEDRFETYTTAASLFTSLATLNSGLRASYSGTITADLSHVGIWGHSNGGHIALSVLAITGVSYPTVLWAPVSKSFPYSILYYTDESDDQGKALRRTLATFEGAYNTDLFSPSLYFKWIKAPIEVHQGTDDHEVPVWWSDDLVALLQKQGRDVTYYTYPGADHNLLPDGWNDAVLRSIVFYNQEFQQ